MNFRITKFFYSIFFVIRFFCSETNPGPHLFKERNRFFINLYLLVSAKFINPGYELYTNLTILIM